MIRKNILWDLLGKISVGSASLVISVVLARLLTPEEFGIVGIVLVFIGIAQSYMDMGFGAAIIQKKEVSERLNNSFFTFNVIVGLLLFAAMFFSANFIARFYDKVELIRLTQVLSVYFIIGSVAIAQKNVLIKLLRFKEIAIVNFLSSVVSGVLAIILALYGYGIWSLVALALSYKVTEVIALWIISDWIPKIEFVFSEVKSVFGFGSMHMIDRVANSVFDNLDRLLIGKIFPIDVLGHYTRAINLRYQFIEYSSNSLNAVLFPSFSKVQDDIEEVKRLYLKGLRLTAFFSIYLSFLLFLIAEDFFVILFSEVWLYGAFMFKFLSVTIFMHTISAISVNLVLGLGYAKLNLLVGLIRKLLLLIPLFFAYFFGIKSFLYTMIIAYVLCTIINLFTAKKVSLIPVKKQIFEFIIPLIIAILLLFLILGLNQYFVGNHRIITLLINTVLFSVSFVLLTLKTDEILKDDMIVYYRMVLNKIFAKK
jgi:teichuronic acid exporter